MADTPVQIAFYAPLKAPTHPVPSGDQRLARLFMQALELAGAKVELVSELRSYRSRAPDATERQQLKVAARIEQRRLLALWRQRPELRPKLWVTYHLYHKAPDLIGPLLCRLLKIPYWVIEASWSPKQCAGPWQWGMRQLYRGLVRAERVIAINPRDLPCVDALREQRGLRRSDYLAPFIDGERFKGLRGRRSRQLLARTFDIPMARRWLLSVAMMRPGDKLDSYRLLAEALAQLPPEQRAQYHWVVIGDGAGRAELEPWLTPLAGHVSLLGRQDASNIANWMAAADLLVWPACNEALGMVFLEAGVMGLPVMAGESPGVASVCAEGSRLISAISGERLAAALALWLNEPCRRSAPCEGGLARATSVFLGWLQSFAVVSPSEPESRHD